MKIVECVNCKNQSVIPMGVDIPKCWKCDSEMIEVENYYKMNRGKK